jgi:hypothetical protein
MPIVFCFVFFALCYRVCWCSFLLYLDIYPSECLLLFVSAMKEDLTQPFLSTIKPSSIYRKCALIQVEYMTFALPETPDNM